MKNLELSNFGVQEMDAKELTEMNGGWFGPWNLGGSLGLRLGGASWNVFRLREEEHYV